MSSISGLQWNRPRPPRRLGAINEFLFARALDKFGDRSTEAFEHLVRDFFKEVVIRVPARTRILTGRARANWQFGPKATEFSFPFPPWPDPIKTGLDNVALWKLSDGSAHYWNNVSYIQDLELLDQMLEGTITELSGELGGYIDALDRAVSISSLEYEL